MEKTQKLTMLKQRYAVLMGRGAKNLKSPGVARKLLRQIRKLETEN